MSLKLTNKTVEFLRQNPDEKFTAREIANWIFETYPDECRQKQERSTATVVPIDNDRALVQQIIREIGSLRSQLQKHQVKTTEGHPRKYYFTELNDSDEIKHAESHELSPATKANGAEVTEHDLYDTLSEFLWLDFKLYSKRIDEKRSHNRRGPRGNKWLYPDLVGIEDLSSDWHRAIKDCVKQYADKRAKLWSFEVKKLINSSNVREVFFQAVSNSSWANFGYLVASEIIEGADGGTMKELRMLSNLHGIGLIQLNAEDPSESQIMIPAKERIEIDWDTANRLTEENKDFKDYITLIDQFYQTSNSRLLESEMKVEQD